MLIPANRFRAGPFQLDLAVPAMRLGEEPADRRAGVQGQRRALAARTKVLDGADDVGVVPDAGAEGEPSLVQPAQPDRCSAPSVHRVEHQPGRLDRIFWQAEVAREHVGAAGGHDREVGNGRAGLVVEEAVDDLVDGAVSTGGDHQLDPVGARLPAELDRMAAVVWSRRLRP